MGKLFLNHSIIFLVWFQLLFLISGCASRVPIGLGYVNQKAVSVYAKPSLKSEVKFALDKSSLYELLAVNVPDKDSQSKLLWFKILTADEIGYVSQEEEIIQKNVSSFTPVIENKFGLVTATQLLLRDAPSQKGKVMDKLKTRETVEILLETKDRMWIDNLDGTWAKVRTMTGKEGFVFTAHVMRGQDPLTLAKTEIIVLNQYGWAILTAEPKKVYSFKEGKLTSAPPESPFPVKGDVAYFSNKLVGKDGKVYFRLIEDRGNYDQGGPQQPDIYYEGYLPSEILKTYPNHARLYMDNFKAALAANGNPKKELLEEIVRAWGDVDLATLNYEEIKFGNKIVLKITFKPKDSNPNESLEDRSALILKEGNNYTNILDLWSRSTIEFFDLDGNRVDEVFVTNGESRTGEVSQALYKFEDSKFVSLISHSSQPGQCGYITISAENIFINDSGCSESQTILYETFNFKLKKGKLVPVK